MIPDSLPVLAPGAHAHRQDGGCFMEWASLLAGERWSDHPQCTHPLLARLARSVNDTVADGSRQRLVPLIPAVIGLVSSDVRWDLELALLAARLALPHTTDVQSGRALAAAVVTMDALLVAHDGRRAGAMRASTRQALGEVPEHAAWAVTFTAELHVTRYGHVDLARAVLDQAVASLAGRSGADRDERLLGVLEQAVELCARLAGRPTADLALGAPIPVG